MKSKLGPSGFIRLVIVPMVLMSLLLGSYAVETNRIYKSLKMTLVKTASVEYGSANYNIEELVDKLDGNIVEIAEDVDTSQIGVQQLVVTLEQDGVQKDVALELEIKDTKAPETEIKKEKISVQQGEDINLLDNIEKVYDVVDGELDYVESEEVKEGKTNYYTVTSELNTNVPGEYEVNIKAVDKFGNISEKKFDVAVERRGPTEEELKAMQEAREKAAREQAAREEEARKAQEASYKDAPASGAGSNVVGIAMKYNGYPYRYGGNSPATGFDCSGFVQYVYSQVGVNLSRSAYTQAWDGVAVTDGNLKPGDIIIWNGGGHSALYIGNGQMIHATNPNPGWNVRVDSIAAWTRINYISAVRRVS